MRSRFPVPRLLLARHGERPVIRYAMASIVALGADTAAFLVLLDLGAAAMPAGVAGYGLGIAVHWLLSSRLVFRDALAAPGADRNRQKALFIATALIGLALTGLIVALGVALALDPRLAKLAAIAVSFFATWCLRRGFVFAPARHG